MLSGRGKFALILVVCLMLVGCVGPAVFANDGNVETTFFGNLQDDGEGCGVYMMLNFVVEILTFGVGIAAAIGITISGITYLTAGGDDGKIMKAKRRIIEIVIGMAVYVVIWAILSFLLPGGALNNSSVCKEGVANDSFFTTPVETADENDNKSGGTSNKNKNKNKNDSSKVDGISDTAQKMIEAAKYYAAEFKENGIKWGWKSAKTWPAIKRVGYTTCVGFVAVVGQKAGVIKKGKYVQIDDGKVEHSGSLNKSKVRVENEVNKKLSALVKAGRVKPGDIIGHASGAHVMIYKGKDSKGKYRCYSAGSNATAHGKGTKFVNVGNDNCSGRGGNYKVGAIIHMK